MVPICGVLLTGQFVGHVERRLVQLFAAISLLWPLEETFSQVSSHCCTFVWSISRTYLKSKIADTIAHDECFQHHRIYADPAYSTNSSMSSVRVSVEWFFGQVVNYWKLIANKWNLRIGLHCSLLVNVDKLHCFCSRWKYNKRLL